MANFNPLVESDYMAYEKVNPNFSFGGHWFSKERFGIVLHKSKRYPFEREKSRVVESPPSEPDSTADPLDWGVLQAEYEYWRKRYISQGFTGIRFDSFIASGLR